MACGRRKGGLKSAPNDSRRPAALTVATAWDVDMMEQWGVAMGKEFYDMGANVQLGPGLSTPPPLPRPFPRTRPAAVLARAGLACRCSNCVF